MPYQSMLVLLSVVLQFQLLCVSTVESQHSFVIWLSALFTASGSPFSLCKSEVVGASVWSHYSHTL